MNHILINTIAVAAVLGVIVFFHELGHFLAAKAFRVRVDTFSLGFGKRLVGVRFGGTDYRLSALPLGGYVRMAGENPMDERSGRPDEFLSKPRWQRFVIALAGPAMNALLAISLLVPVYMRAYPRDPVLDQPAVVGVVSPGSPAAAAGLHSLDRIVRYDGVNNPTWETVLLRSAVVVNHAVSVTVQRGSQRIQTSLTPRASNPSDPPELGMSPVEITRFGEIVAGSPAAAAGLRAGDQVVSLDGARVLDPESLIGAIQKAEPAPAASRLGAVGTPLRLGVVRAGHAFTVQVAPKLSNAAGAPRWMIGAGIVSDVTFVRLPFAAALEHSLQDNRRYAMLIVDLVGKLISRQASIRTLQSPVGIASVAGQAARAPTILPLFSLTSLISLNLGILNLLPIPVLDGGMILFLFIEAIMRHDISARIKERVYQVGFAFLLILMTVVVYNDIVRVVVHRN